MTGVRASSWDEVEWQQFAYASVGRLPGTDRGGWGTIASTTTVEVMEAFRGWVSGRLESGVTMPDFPEPRDLEGRPVRLRAGVDARRPGGPVEVFAHSIDAGQDASDRPGNVCTHVALAPTQTLPRPIELWRSPDWARPYRAEQTAGVRLPARLRPGPLNAEYIRGWAASGDGAMALGWMLDAAAHARASRRLLVLATRSPDEAAHWIAVFSHLSARAVGPQFSTFEDALSLDTARGLGLWVIGMGAEAIPSALFGLADVLVVDPRWHVEPEPDGGGWRLPGGRRVPAGPWPVVAVELFDLETQADAVLTAADTLAASIGPEVEQAPIYWCTATALLLADGIEVMDRVTLLKSVLQEAPDGAPEETLDTLLDEYTSAGGLPGSGRWQELTSARNRVIRESALSALVEACLQNDDVDDAPAIAPLDRSGVAYRLRREIAAAMDRGPEPVREYLLANGLAPHPEPTPAAPGRRAGQVPAHQDRAASGWVATPGWDVTEPMDVRPLPRIELEMPADLPEVALPDPTPQPSPSAAGAGAGAGREPAAAARPAPQTLATGDLLRRLDALSIDRTAVTWMAEAVLRLHKILTDEHGLVEMPVELSGFAAYYLAGEPHRAPVGEKWAVYAAQVWQHAAQAGRSTEQARSVLLGEIVAAAARDPKLWPVLPPELTEQVAARIGPSREHAAPETGSIAPSDRNSPPNREEPPPGRRSFLGGRRSAESRRADSGETGHWRGAR